MNEFKQAFKGVDSSAIRKSIQKELTAAEKDVEKFRQQYDAIMNGDATPKSIVELQKQLDVAQGKVEKLKAAYDASTGKSTKEVEKELAKAQEQVDKLTTSYRALLESDTPPRSVQELQKELNRTVAEGEKLSKKLAELRHKRELLIDTGGRFSAGVVGERRYKDVSGAERYISDPKTIDKIQELDYQIKNINNSFIQLDVTETQVRDKLKEMALNPDSIPEVNSLKQQITESTAKVTELQAKLADLQANPLSVEETRAIKEELSAAETRAADLSHRLAELRANPELIPEVQRIRESLEGAEGRAAELKYQLENVQTAGTAAGEGVSGAIEGASTSVSRFTRRIGRLAKRVLFFSVITMAFRSIRKYVTSAIQQNDELANSIAMIKGNAQVIFEFLMTYIVPALNFVLKIIVQLTTIIARFLSILTGKSVSSAKKAVKALNSVGAAAEKATEKSLASFDTINQLDTSSDSGAGGGAGSTIQPSFDALDFESAISELMIYLMGAMLALGVVLAFSGINIPLGIALIAAGAAGLIAVVSPNWAELPAEIKGAVNDVLTFLAIAGLVIGAILAFSGANIPLGIGLMLLGAVSLGAAAKLNWNGVEDYVSHAVESIDNILGIAFLVIGAVLAFAGVSLPLGIALIALGATQLASAASMDENAVPRDIKGFINRISIILAGALAVLGVILLLTANIPLGLGLLAAGAIIYTTAAGFEPQTMIKRVSDFLDALGLIVGAASVVLGVIMLFNPATLGLGLALIFAGCSLVKQAFTLTDNPIINWVKGLVNSVINILNWLVRQINKLSFDVPDWVPAIGGRHFGFNIKQIPYLANGAVIPPNREFLAVLGDQKSGTNIETPLATMVQAFRQALAEDANNRYTSNTPELIINGSLAALAEVLDIEIRQTRRAKGV